MNPPSVATIWILYDLHHSHGKTTLKKCGLCKQLVRSLDLISSTFRRNADTRFIDVCGVCGECCELCPMGHYKIKKAESKNCSRCEKPGCDMCIHDNSMCSQCHAISMGVALE